MAISDQIIASESGGDPAATNPNSSASGLGQFIDSTWAAMLRQHRPDLAEGKSDAELAALKSDPQLSRDMTAAYAADNAAILAKNGLPVTPGSTYLAHFAGPGGAVKILQADPDAPVSDILGPAAVKANPFLQGMTARGLQAWAARKMGVQPPIVGGAPSQATPQNNAQANSAGPATPVPAPRAPIFANAGPSPAGMAAPMQMPTAPRSPIILPQPKPIDLSGLAAALAAARAPIFASS